MNLSSNIKLFHKLYVENLLRVDWNKKDLGLGVSRKINSTDKQAIDKTVVNDFMTYVTEIMDYVTKKDYEKSDVFYELQNIMGDDFDKIVYEAEKSATIIEPTLEGLDVEYLTKRSYRDIKHIIGYNAKLKLNLSNDEEITIELDEQQLTTFSESLTLALEELKSLKK